MAGGPRTVCWQRTGRCEGVARQDLRADAGGRSFGRCAQAGGSQFTGAAFTSLLLENAIAISMDGRGSWRDNVFVERLWRSVKYEEVYLHAYDIVGQARASLGRYLDSYNRKRSACLANTVVGMQIDLLVLDRSPQP